MIDFDLPFRISSFLISLILFIWDTDKESMLLNCFVVHSDACIFCLIYQICLLLNFWFLFDLFNHQSSKSSLYTSMLMLLFEFCWETLAMSSLSRELWLLLQDRVDPLKIQARAGLGEIEVDLPWIRSFMWFCSGKTKLDLPKSSSGLYFEWIHSIL